MSLRKRISLRNTLAFRLTLWYAGIFTVSSCIAFLLFYTLITSFIHDRTDQELLGQVNRFSTLFAAEGIEAVTECCRDRSPGSRGEKGFFRLLSLNGQAFSSSNMSYWKDIPISETAIKELLRGSQSCLRNHRHSRPQGGSAHPLCHAQPQHHSAGGPGHGELFPVPRRLQGNLYHHHDLPDRRWLQASAGSWPDGRFPASKPSRERLRRFPAAPLKNGSP